MRFSHIFILLAGALLFAGCQSGADSSNSGAATGGGSSAPTTDVKTFAEVQPILNQNCSGCHGATPKEGYDVRSHDSVMKGGRKGPLVTPGDPAQSLLIQVLKGEGGHRRMPPAGPLGDGDIQKIESWIKNGAKA